MWVWIGSGFVALIAAVTVYDLVQKKHAILRNFLALGRNDAPPGLARGLPESESPTLPPTGAPEA